MLGLTPHDDDVERIDDGRTENGETAEQGFGAEVGLGLADENHDHAGKGGERAADGPPADRLLEDRRRQHQRDQRGDEGQRHRLGHRHPGEAPEEQDRHRHHHRPAQQVEAQCVRRAARDCG